MATPIPWLEKKFEFEFDTGVYPELIERLRGTPARLEDRLNPLTVNVLTHQPQGEWSIQEHAGHLLDLEALFIGRLDDFLADKPTLRGADMSNQKTHEADHNTAALATILDEFRQTRLAFVAQLDALDPTSFGKTALHPRLNVSLRLVDSLLFQAIHDDHHLAQIAEILQPAP
ncbi:MAG: DinB family protein [Chloroflexota bacterium]